MNRASGSSPERNSSPISVQRELVRAICREKVIDMFSEIARRDSSKAPERLGLLKCQNSQYSTNPFDMLALCHGWRRKTRDDQRRPP